MSLFDQRMSSGPRALLMLHNADPIAVTLAGGPPVNMLGIIGFAADTEVESNRDGRKLRSVRDVTVARVAGCEAQPISDTYPYGGLPQGELTAVVTINSEEYAVEAVLSESGTFLRLLLSQTQVMAKGRPGIRPRT